MSFHLVAHLPGLSARGGEQQLSTTLSNCNISHYHIRVNLLQSMELAALAKHSYHIVFIANEISV